MIVVYYIVVGFVIVCAKVFHFFIIILMRVYYAPLSAISYGCIHKHAINTSRQRLYCINVGTQCLDRVGRKNMERMLETETTKLLYDTPLKSLKLNNKFVCAYPFPGWEFFFSRPFLFLFWFYITPKDCLTNKKQQISPLLSVSVIK